MRTKNYFGLSHREQEIYELLVKGYSKFEIAEILTLEVSTIRTHVHNIYQKKGFDGRNALQRMVCGHYTKLLENLGVKDSRDSNEKGL